MGIAGYLPLPVHTLIYKQEKEPGEDGDDMQAAKKLAIMGCATMALYLLTVSGAAEQLGELAAQRLGDRRMKNVAVVREIPPAAVTAEPLRLTVAATEPPWKPVMAEAESPATPEMELPEQAEALPEQEAAENGEILETTIQGGLSVNNATGYWVDVTDILSAGPGLTLPQGDAQILIIHTHSSEAYTQAGLNVIHDRGIYDYPSYTGSYTRSGQAIEQYLQSYPGIRMVIDIHRDALGTDDVVYKTMAEEDGVCASQVMLLVGTDESGLEHPNWRQNLAVALYLQNAVNAKHPTLMRPIALVQQRYNQHLSPGSLILEVGSNGNTLREALAAIRLFGQAAAPALAELVE